jgi:hypothetical protein
VSARYFFVSSFFCSAIVVSAGFYAARTITASATFLPASSW